ncbi:neuromedin U [Thermodesulfobacteriota bacterium]
MNKTSLLILLGLTSIIAAGPVLCQGASESDLAKEAQNPIANLISVPFQNNTNFGWGPGDETQNVLNIQPVLPVSINDNWNLITRTIFPVISQPDFLTGGEGRTNGLGDITFSAFFSPKGSPKLTWGVGPIFLFPSATDDALGADKWGAGASLVALAMPGHWVIGSLFSNVWSFAGSGNQDVNLFTWQYFINYNLPKAWYLTSAPIITANWEASSGNKWTVPFGGGFGKVFHIGKQPVNGQIQAFYNVEKPQFGPDWQLRFQLQFLFPKK